MKKIILAAVLGTATIGANAGDWGKAPVAPAKAPIEECYDIGGKISSGYQTDFIFQGSRHARDTIWTDVNYTIDTIVPLTLGATYYNHTNAPGFQNGIFDDFLHTYASAAVGSFGGFDTTLQYHHVFFPEGAPAGVSSQGVITLGLKRDLGFAALALGTNYAAAGSLSGGWYHTAGLEKTFGLTDAVSLVLGTGVGYNDQYWVHSVNQSGWANYYVTASLPIELNCRATLTPYIGYNGGIAYTGGATSSDNVLTGSASGDVLHGGVSLSVSF